jgi:hypothetical protein
MTHPLDAAIDRGETPVELLNGLTSDGFGWVLRRANKTHDDQFGQPIHAGEEYYARDLPVGRPLTYRLSLVSMERLLDTVFSVNHFGTTLACKLSKDREERHNAAMLAAVAALENPAK